MQTVVITTTVYTQKTLCDPRASFSFRLLSLSYFCLSRSSPQSRLHVHMGHDASAEDCTKALELLHFNCQTCGRNSNPLPELRTVCLACCGCCKRSCCSTTCFDLCVLACAPTPHPKTKASPFRLSELFLRCTHRNFLPSESDCVQNFRKFVSALKQTHTKQKNGPRRKSNYVGQFITEDNQNLEEALQALHIDNQTCRPPFVLPERAAARLPAGVVGILGGVG